MVALGARDAGTDDKEHRWPWNRSCWRFWPAPTPITPRCATTTPAQTLTCTECERVFPIRDGLPVLLLDEATGGKPEYTGRDGDAA